MLTPSYDALRQLQSKFHKIKNFQELKSTLEELGLQVYFHMRSVGYESVRLDVVNECFSNLERVFIDVTIADKTDTLFQDSLEVETYPRNCSFADLQYIWVIALKKKTLENI